MYQRSILPALVLAALLSACGGGQSQQQAPAAASAPAPQAVFTPGEGVSIRVLIDTISSPRKQLSIRLDSVDLTITYGSPSVKGRALWGGLVPYGEVWRTGANEATTFEVSAPVKIGGQTLPAGTYALFTIPAEGDWTLIFNSVHDQWGAYDYKEAQDVLRAKVTPVKAAALQETLEFNVAGKKEVQILWGDLVVPFAVEPA
jgi:hypothetical protein